MKPDDVKELIDSSKEILEYFNKFGTLYWEGDPFSNIENYPTRSHVPPSDYIRILVDIENSIKFLEGNIPLDNEKNTILHKLKGRFAKIILENMSEDFLLSEIDDTISKLVNEEITKDCSSDLLFHYEGICDFRDLIEKQLTVLKTIFLFDDEVENRYRMTLKETDRFIMALKERIQKENPHNATRAR